MAVNKTERLRQLAKDKPHLTSAAAANLLGVDIKCISRIAKRANVTLQDARRGVDIPLPEIRVGK